MAKRIFLDTNVWLRFFNKNEPKQYKATVQLFEKIEAGEFIPYVSDIIFLEVYYVLTSFYGISKKKAVGILEVMLELRNLVVLRTGEIKKALTWHKKYNLKFSDCLIAASLPKNLWLVSWDREFGKIEEVRSIPPA